MTGTGGHITQLAEAGADHVKHWPLSNYPIFFALVFLSATAVVLAMGDETLSEQLAIYAYYLLVAGVTLRFFELTLPADTLQVKLLRLAEQLRRNTPRAPAITPPKHRMIPHWKTQAADTWGRLWQRLCNAEFMDITYLEEVSRNTTTLLLAFMALSLLFALMGGWWLVRTYIANLLIIIFTTSTIYLLTRSLRDT